MEHQKKGGITQQYATIHDVITAANFAYNENKKNQGDEYNSTSSDIGINDPIHIRIDLEGENGGIKITNLENHPEAYNELISTCYYKNSTNPNVNAIINFSITINSQNNAGKINHVTFKSADSYPNNSATNAIKSVKNKFHI